ncbi:SusE domain-containing protein [Mesonia aestuariivivens]|uniref:SusE domain-containing protein n=1 Tax=Mesonia aestuariivivens TaxID=2796128 RepID=A0ABS6W3N9_9FLAO|nr:SusE domain-containing protein [Mesonia aestuariivivens]MBW2962483.1 SusE domain-containing protein [Mesonia aestuariivivens]
MKNFYIYLLISCLGFVSCSDDDITIIDTQAESFGITTPSEDTSLILLQENAEDEALNLEWEEANFKVNTPINYQVELSTESNNFSEVIKLAEELKNTSFQLTTSDFNTKLAEVGLAQNTTETILIRIKSYLGSSNTNAVKFSTPVRLTVTTYEPFIDLSTTWGIVGSAAPNGWDGPDASFWKTNQNGVDNQEYVAYTTLTDGEIKFRENNDWANNYGGSDGQLVAGGDNIAVSAGTYKININLNELTYNLEEYSWGIVGSATPNGWDGPDIQLKYDGVNKVWRVENINLTDGEIKFRFNNTWGGDFGGTNGELIEGGDNITVSAGTYTIIVDFNNNTYSIE